MAEIESTISKVKIEMDALGRGTFILNGEDISKKVRGFTFTMSEPGRNLALVTIDFYAEVELEGFTTASSVFGMNMLGMVEALSPKEIEEEALNNLGMGDNVTEAILNLVKRKIRDAAESR